MFPGQGDPHHLGIPHDRLRKAGPSWIVKGRSFSSPLTAVLAAVADVLSATMTTTTFSTSGAHTFTIPTGITSIDVECWGGCTSSSGGYTKGTLAVTPGDIYAAYVSQGAATPTGTGPSVNGAPGAAGGIGSGGEVHYGPTDYHGRGAASTEFWSPSAARLMVAGGAGGIGDAITPNVLTSTGTAGVGGAGTGGTGGNPTPSFGNSATGGTGGNTGANNGGTGGTGAGSQHGTGNAGGNSGASPAGRGGSGAGEDFITAGAGGGGYCGGAGGGEADDGGDPVSTGVTGGGGGGSNYIDASFTSTTNSAGVASPNNPVGQVSITYTSNVNATAGLAAATVAGLQATGSLRPPVGVASTVAIAGLAALPKVSGQPGRGQVAAAALQPMDMDAVRAGVGAVTAGAHAPSTEIVNMYPTPRLLIALTDPLSLSPETVDVTQWCMGVDTTYGRQHELQQIEAQTLVAQLDDLTGLFSSWNASAPFVNLLSYVDSTLQQGDIGSWDGIGITLVVGGGGPDSTPTLFMSTIGLIPGTPMAARTTDYTPVTEGMYYTGFASFATVYGSGGGYLRNCSVALEWRDAGGSILSTSTGATVTETASGFVKATVTDVAPSGATQCSLKVIVANAGGVSESHLAVRMGITQRYTDMSSGYILDVAAWGPGGFGLAIGREAFFEVSYNDIDYYPLAFGYLEKNVPTIVDEVRKSVTLSFADGLKYFANQTVDSSLYPGWLILNEASLYWRFGDPVGTLLVSDFSKQGNLGFIDIFAGGAGGSVSFQNPGLLNEDVGTSALISGDLEIRSQGASPLPDVPVGACFGMLIKLDVAATPPSTLLLLEFGGGIGIGVNTSGQPVFIKGGSTTVLTSAHNVCDGDTHWIAAGYDQATGDAVLYVDNHAAVTGTTTTGELRGADSFVLTPLWTSGSFSAPAYFQEVWVIPLSPNDPSLSDNFFDDLFDFSVAGFTIPGGAINSSVLCSLFLLSAGFPLDLLSFEIGNSEVLAPQITLGTTGVLSVVNQIVASEQGLFYQDRSGFLIFLNRHYIISAPSATTVQATFENAEDSPYLYLPGNFQPVLDDEDLWNDVPTQVNATGVTGPLHDVQDPNSIQRFGLRTLQGYTSMLYADDGEATDLGQWLLGAYSVPYTRIRSAQISSIANNGLALPQMIQRDLIDLLAFIYNPQDAGTNFNQEAQIEKIQQRFTKGRMLVTTWQLTPYIFGGTSWFTLNHPILGQLAGPGSDIENRLAF